MRNYKLGLWGARMDASGLGIQTLEFYRHLQPDKTLVVDISVLEQVPSRRLKQYPGRYPDATIIQGFPNTTDIEVFLQGLDVVFVAESAYNNDFYRIAKDLGVKVANQYNFEFFDWFVYPQFVLPDLFIAPSRWHYDEVDRFCQLKGIKHTYLHCPVDLDDFKMRWIDQAQTFVHIAGRPATHDRNGTQTFCEAIQLGDGLIKGLIYTQSEEQAAQIKADYKHIKVKTGVEDYHKLYRQGEVLVLPRRYGGNCLPMNEALAVGMPVIMPDISPNSEFLPKHWLVSATETDIEFTPRVRIPVYEASVHALYLKMLWFHSLSEGDMAEQSALARYQAEQISWQKLAPEYERVLGELCQ